MATEPSNSGTSSSSSSGGPVLFWREHEQPYGFLSQWYRCNFSHEGHEFNCTEQWMMWNKATLFGDEETAQLVLKSKSPRKQKELGRQVKNFDGKKWDQHKLAVVEQGNNLKFTQSTTTFPDGNGVGVPLRKLLLETGDRELVEASPFDRIWGIGFAAQFALKAKREAWGENLLGIALMKVREGLKKEEEQSR